MRREYFKSLDRPLNIFGLRGGWIKNFGIFCGIAFGVAVVVGIAMGMGPAMGIFIAGLAVSFFACLVLQAKTPARRLGKVRLRQKMNIHVIRRETLSRIVLGQLLPVKTREHAVSPTGLSKQLQADQPQ